MAGEFLDDRRRALEDSFFAKQNQAQLRQIRERQAAGERRQVLRETSGLHDEALLERLETLGIEAETLAALSVVPLVAVAWAAGVLDESEREAVLRGAEESGLASGDAAWELLRDWLREPPSPDQLATWRDYTRALCAELDGKQRAVLREELIGRARAVADAAGGFLGLGNRISKEEAALIRELESAFA